ncbi:hypothetical protein K474DRAFT_1607182, partial [Panus rudis PR-1116 ss-1]
GLQHRRLPSVGYIEHTEPSPFGFVDPNQVIRAAHLIPDFSSGCTTQLLPRSCIRNEDEDDEDWNLYYVNIFVDRDMFMRYLGGGVGHAELDTLRNFQAPDTASSGKTSFS